MPAVSVGVARSLLSGADYTLSEVSIPADAGTIPPHRHDRAQIYLVLEGEYSERARGVDHSLGPGSVLFRPAGESHSNAFSASEVHGMLIELEPAANREMLPGMAGTPAYFHAHVFDRLAASIDGEARRADPEAPTAMTGLVLCLAAEVSRFARADLRPDGALPWLDRAESLLRRRFAEDLRVSRLARSLEVRPVTLAAAFRRRYRCSVGQYLLRTRLAEARRRLAGSDDPIGRIALDCGFFDQAHFTRVFKRQHGATPGAFRRARRG